MQTRSVLFGWFLVLSACGSTPEATEPAATASADTAAPQVSAAASAEATPALSASAAASTATSAAAPAAASAPTSRYTIGGQSLSEVDFATLQAEVKRAGYELPGPGEPTLCGDNENFQLGVRKKGKPAGVMSLSRRGKSTKLGCSPSSNKESLAAWKKGIDDPKGTTAYVFDEEADVLFMVNLMSENKAAAQKLVDALAKKP